MTRTEKDAGLLSRIFGLTAQVGRRFSLARALRLAAEPGSALLVGLGGLSLWLFLGLLTFGLEFGRPDSQSAPGFVLSALWSVWLWLPLATGLLGFTCAFVAAFKGGNLLLPLLGFLLAVALLLVGLVVPASLSQ